MKKELFILYLLILAIFYSCDNSVDYNADVKIYDIYPCWSPDGSKIFFAGGGLIGVNGIYSVDLTTFETELITDKPVDFDISPDGEKIVYTFGGNIYIKNMSAKSDPIALTSTGNNFHPSWSKNGNWIAFDSNNDSPNGMHFVWKMRIDGSEKKRIIYTPAVGEVRQPSWFPDGTRLAVLCYVNYSAGDIGIIDTSGNLITLTTNDSNHDLNPKVSNDGNYIVFERNENRGQVCIIKTDGTDLKILLDNYSRYPNWSNNDNQIVYTNALEGGLWVIDRNGLFSYKILY